MRPVNIKSVVIANKELSKVQRDSLYEFWGITPKPEEIGVLERLVDELVSLAPKRSPLITRLLGGCFLGFEIPHISKEFDCLWIGEKTIVNLELKSQIKDKDAIKKQLVQNRYYLHHLPQAICSFSFIGATGDVFSLDGDSNLVGSSLKEFGSALYAVHNETLEELIEPSFPPGRFLISPFNSTKEFLEGRFFLTDQQRKVKAAVLRFVNDASAGGFCAISGGPGTGKTLLLYDIAQTLEKEGKRVMIGHAGALNSGHTELVENGWAIKSTKDLVFWDHSIYKRRIVDEDIDVFLIDEAQRCYPYIIDALVEEIGRGEKKCLFSYDADQIMSNGEQARRNDERIQSLVNNNSYRLTSGIRTNSEVYSFIKGLFNKRHQANNEAFNHVEISYCKSVEEARDMLDTLRKEGYFVPKFTPMLHGTEDYESWFLSDEPSAHEIIGQEFDNVVGLLSANLYYDENGKLASHGKYYYREDRMLYQILTRARHKIHLVIMNNPLILERCLRLLKNKRVSN